MVLRLWCSRTAKSGLTARVLFGLRVIVFSFGSRAGWLEPEEAIMTGFALRCLFDDRTGQDLIEYALVVALIAFAAISGMGSVATAINNAFVGIGNTLTTNI